MAGEAFELKDVFLIFLDVIGVSTCCRGVVAIITLLALLTSRTSLLVVLIFFASLALVGVRLLVLATRYVSGKRVSEFNLSRVFFLLLYGLVSLGTP